MQFDFNFYSSLLLIFFVHTVVYSCLFIYKYKKYQEQPALWMGLFLVLTALYICPWMLGFAGWYDHQPYRDIIFYVPFQHLFLIGPFTFFYISSLFNPKFSIKGKNLLHLIPAAAYLLYCIITVVYDKVIIGKYYFLKSGEDPDFDAWYQVTGYMSIVFYFIASIRYYYSYKKAIESVISNAASFLFTWVKNFLIAFLVILVLRLIITVAGLFYNINFFIDWWYFLGFAICCYYIAIAAYSNSVKAKLFFKGSFLSPAHNVYLASSSKTYALDYQPADFEEIIIEDNDITGETILPEYMEWKEKITRLLTGEHLYENPELTLFDMARVLNTNVSFLSKVINNAFKMNFNDLVNSYRVNQFVALLNNGGHKKQTLLALAFDCGFNSKTTFNRSFKKITGATPAEYIKNNNL